MIGRRLGHYEVVEQLGAGGMGVVYRARDTRLQRDIALKVLPEGTVADENARKRFCKEALALSRLNHPNIATIHDFDSDGGVDFIVMELIHGLTLYDKAANAAMPEAEVIRLGSQLADGLAAAHAQGVLHRDLKPANLRLTPDGRLKILDFGLARLLEPPTTGAATDVNTSAHIVAGTLPYMAPEQLKGEQLDPRTDVYGAGAVLYELATGKLPFEGPTSAHLIASILQDAPKPPTTLNRNVSPALEQVILKALDKNPDRRYQSAKELVVDLERLRTGSEITVRRPVSRRGVATISAVAAIVVIVMALNRDAILDLIVPPHNESIAVLPLANLSKDPQQDYFVDGMTRELITQLGRVESLRVTGSFSSMRYKKVSAPLPKIGRELNVAKLLSGSVMRVGDRARIDLELIDARNGRTLWSQAYDQNVRDVLTAQATIAQAVAHEVGVRLTRRDKEKLAKLRPVDPEAHASYLKAISAWDASRAGEAQREFERAVSIDPNFAQAWSSYAYFLIGRAWFAHDLPPMVAYPKAKEMALKAIALDDSISLAHAVLATVKLHHEWDWAGAEGEFRRAIELNPSEAAAHHLYAHYLMTMDRLTESVAETRKAAQLEPLNPAFATCVGWHCLYARQYDDAIATCMGLVNQERANAATYYYLGRVYARKGHLDQAIPALETAVSKSGSLNSMLATLGYVYGLAGKRAEAEQVLTQLHERSKTKYVAALDFAVVYAGLDDREQTFDWLEKAYLERSTWLVHIKWDDRFVNIRSDPRFTELLRRIGLPNPDMTHTPDTPAQVRQVAYAAAP